MGLPAIVGKYRVGRTIGEGTFAKVKLATNMETGKSVAVKIIDKKMVLQNNLMYQVDGAGVGGRDGPLEEVEADVEDGEAAEEADLGRDTGGEAVVKEDDLVEGVGHAANGGQDAAAELVVGEDDDEGERVAEVGGDGAAGAVGVKEDGVEVAVEEGGGEVEVAEGGEVENDAREGADKVVAEVELAEDGKAGKGAVP